MNNNKLQHLDIAHNDIGDDGVRHIAEGLQQNDALIELRLRNCQISVKGNYIYNCIIIVVAVCHS